MRNPTGTVLLPVLLFLAACGQETNEEPAGDSSRFSLVTQNNETCIADSDTGLLWAGKTDSPGLHDYRNTYTWHDPTEVQNERDYRGVADGGECAGSKCDTWHHVAAVNEAGYCNHNDWRLPTKGELQSTSTSAADAFSLSHAAEYWSGDAYPFQWDAAWAWNFQFDQDRVDWKKTPKYVRLVRGSGENLAEVSE